MIYMIVPKTYNSSIVLQTIRNEGEISRGEIAKKTDLNKSTLTNIIAPLVNDGIIISIDNYLNESTIQLANTSLTQHIEPVF